MGRGIAEVTAVAGFETVLTDVSTEVLEQAREQVRRSLERSVEKGRLDRGGMDAAMERLRMTTELEAAVRDSELIIEAVPEDPELKKDLLSELDVLTSAEAMYGSNTSSISISSLAGAVERRDRFIGLHFFNPVPAMKLVEIVVGERTSEQTVRDAQDFVEAIGKIAIVVRDSPGFATSRLGVVIGLEAIRMLEEGIASAEDIDRAMELGYRHPMGPLRLTDLVGLDVRLSIAEYLSAELGPRFDPPALLRQLVSEGKLGQKSGEGFYRWEVE